MKGRNKRHPALVVLNALIEQTPVRIDGEEFWMDAATRQLCIVRQAENVKTGRKREVLLDGEMTVRAFIKMCERLSEEEVWEIGGNNVLNTMKRKVR